MPLNIIIDTPNKANTIPTKKNGFNFSSFKKIYANKAEIKGEIDTKSPTFDARVYERAVFSRIRYKNIPKKPARTKSSSFFMLYIGANFGYIINRYDREGTLFYLDPPYYGTESYYTEKFQKEDHERLKGLLDNIKGKFILSYNDCGYIRELYRDYNITEADRMHNLAGGGKTKPRYKELLVKNY